MKPELHEVKSTARFKPWAKPADKRCAEIAMGACRKQAIDVAFCSEFEYQLGEGAVHPGVDSIIGYLDSRLLDSDEKALEILYSLFDLALAGKPGDPMTLTGLDTAYAEGLKQAKALMDTCLDNPAPASDALEKLESAVSGLILHQEQHCKLHESISDSLRELETSTRDTVAYVDALLNAMASKDYVDANNSKLQELINGLLARVWQLEANQSRNPA